MPALYDTEIKASRAVQARVWRQFDAFVESRIPRWSGRAQAILNNEAELAASAYREAGAAAALASVDDREWQDYIRRLWLTVVPEAGPVIRPFLGSVAKAADNALLRAAAEWVRVNGVREAANISNASRKGIQEQIRIGIKKGESEEQIAARIRKHYRSVRQSRADTIARTEVHAAANYGSLSAAADSERGLRKIWVDTPDHLVRDAHEEAAGQKRPLPAPFVVDGELLMFPGDGSMGASSGNLVNCRCHMAYEAASRTMPRRPRKPRVAA